MKNRDYSWLILGILVVGLGVWLLFLANLTNRNSDLAKPHPTVSVSVVLTENDIKAAELMNKWSDEAELVARLLKRHANIGALAPTHEKLKALDALLDAQDRLLSIQRGLAMASSARYANEIRRAYEDIPAQEHFLESLQTERSRLWSQRQ